MRSGQRGKLIVLEGIDGCGKTTQLTLLKKWLKQKGVPAIFTQEHTRGGEVGKLIEKAVHHRIKLPLLALQFLFVADRVVHLERVIEPALAAGKVVVVDRYLWSTVAYGSLVAEPEWLLELHRYCRFPDLVIFLDVPVKVALQRLQTRKSKPAIFEKRKKLARVRKSYLWLAAQFKASSVIINGEGDPQQIHQQICRVLTKWIRFFAS